MCSEKKEKQLNDNNKFCLSCGTKVEHEIQVEQTCCPICGSRLNDDDQFYDSDGAKIRYDEVVSDDFDDKSGYIGNKDSKKQSVKRIMIAVFLFFFIVGAVYAISNFNSEDVIPVIESSSEIFNSKEDNDTTEQKTTESKPEKTTSDETKVQTTTPATTEATTSVTTTKPTPEPMTTISPNVTISDGSSGGSTLQFTANGNVSDSSYVWSSSNIAVATVSNGTVTAVGEGTAIITVTMNGVCSASKTVIVGINWDSEYTTYSQESESSLKKLVSSHTEWKYYSAVCGNCGYYDYWGTGVRCNQIYPKGCEGTFNNWIYTWSTNNPNSLPFKTADHGVRSYIDVNNREWYWTTYAGFNVNEERTVYTYKQGSYYISSVI